MIVVIGQLIVFGVTLLSFSALEHIWVDVDLHVRVLRDRVHHAIVGFLVLIDELGEWDLVEDGLSGHLHEQGDQENSGTGNDASTPFASVQWGGTDESAEPLDGEDLDEAKESDDSPEPPVDLAEGQHSLEHVQLILSNLSAVDVVEHLEEYECAEHVSVKLELRLGTPVGFAFLTNCWVSIFDSLDLLWSNVISTAFGHRCIESVSVVLE